MADRSTRAAGFPSVAVIVSILAVAMAAIAFVATRGDNPQTERDITPVAEAPASTEPSAEPSVAPSTPPKPKPKPVDRAKTYVVVYNNSGISGLAGQVATKASDAGWQVVGSDNWYGTIPSNTVYHAPKMKRAATTLARDLGIARVMPAVDPMRLDRLTVILTGPLG